MLMSAASSVYAHQGGWDEILFVLAPLAVFAGLLVMARRRVDRLEADDERAGDRHGHGEERDGVEGTDRQ